MKMLLIVSKGKMVVSVKISDFLPVDVIPEHIKNTKLSKFKTDINYFKFPLSLNIPFENDEPCNNQTLGNQIPIYFKII